MSVISVVIPTYNRYKDLTVCIDSILKQSRRPDELIIVDDGNLPDVPLQHACERAGIKIIYFKKDKPGLTASRNQGVRLASGDLLFFLDDDVELFTDYLANIVDVFQQDKTEKIGGVGGMIVNEPPLSRSKKLRRLLDLCFLVTGSTEGKVLKSGFCVNFGSTGRPLKQLTQVDFLAGGVCAYRKDVFTKFCFDENYKGYGLGEDKDFSYRVSKYYQLMVTPEAKLNHYESPQMRFDHRRMGYEFIISCYRFFKVHVHSNVLNTLAFSYAILGYTLGRFIITCLSFNKKEFNRLFGIINGIWDIVTNKAKHTLQQDINAQEKKTGLL